MAILTSATLSGSMMTMGDTANSSKRLVYISAARIPTGRAHGLQIMHMCAAFANAGLSVELVVPGKRNFAGQDPFDYYKIRPTFSIRRVAMPDLGSRTRFFPYVLFLFDVFSFVVSLFFSKVSKPGDIIYCRDYPLLFLCSPKRNRVVIEMHDIPRWHRLLLRALAHATTIVAITQGLKDDLVHLGVTADKITVASDAVDLNEFANPEPRAKARARLNLPLDKHVALYIGRIDAWKGTDVLLRAVTLLPEDVVVGIIGGQPEQIAKLAPKNPRVQFFGIRPYHELADNQAAADVLILPNSGRFDISARYTSPLKLFSYMTSGIPIVASDLPSVREVLDERSAFLVRPDDPTALARGIEEALTSPEKSARAKRARELSQKYTWDARVARILATIKRTV